MVFDYSSENIGLMIRRAGELSISRKICEALHQLVGKMLIGVSDYL